MKAYPIHNRAFNRGRILRSILRDGPLARVDLAQRTQLTAAAISNITRELINDQLLREVGATGQGRVGANAILLDLPTDRSYVAAVHQGVSALRVALCDLRGQVLAKRVIMTPASYAPEWCVRTVRQTIHSLIEEIARPARDLFGVGFGAVGLVDDARGIVKRSPSIGWQHVPIRDLLQAAIGRPVEIENNIRAMAIGEAMIGAGRAQSSFAFVYIGTGIGSGIIVDQHPFRGAYGGAGELGHITVDPEGKRCTCGNRGCLETIAAEPAIVTYARDHGWSWNGPDDATAKDFVRALGLCAAAGDGLASSIISATGESLGVALATLVDLLNPGRIVLHGAITAAEACFFDAVAKTLHQRAFLAGDEQIDLVQATFGGDAGLVGAAIVAIDALLLKYGALPSAIAADDLDAAIAPTYTVNR